MELTKQELERLKACEMQILSDFDKYCRANDLQYYVIGGALLGAARYGDLIPWDDDIDVAMPREDYERLWREYRSDRYFLQNATTDPLFARCIQKIRMNGTSIIEYTTQNMPGHQGIYIDIFPIDYVNTDDPDQIAPVAKRIRRLMTLRTIKSGYRSSRHAFAKRLIKLFYPMSAKRIDQKIDRLCTQQNNGTRAYTILWLHNYSWDKQIHRKEIWGTGGACHLKGRDFAAPVDMNAFLSRVFGENYLQDPPKEKQKNPHSYICVSFGSGMNE